MSSYSRAPSSASSFELLPMYSSLSTRSPSQMTELPTHEMFIRSGTPSSTRSQSRGSLVAETAINRQQLASEFQDLVRIGSRSSTDRPSSIESSARPTSQNQVALGPYPANTPPEPRSLVFSRSSSSTQASARPTSQNQVALGQGRSGQSSIRATSQNQVALNRPPSTQSSARPTSQNQMALGQQQNQMALEQQPTQLISGQQQNQIISGQQQNQIISGQQQIVPGQHLLSRQQSLISSRQGFRPPTAPPAISNGQLGYQPALPYGGIQLGQPAISDGARQYRTGQMPIGPGFDSVSQVIRQNNVELNQPTINPNTGQQQSIGQGLSQNTLGQPPLLYPPLFPQQNLLQQQPVGPPPIYTPQVINQIPVQRSQSIDPEMVWNSESPGIEIQTAGVQRANAPEPAQNGLFVSLPSPQQAFGPPPIQTMSPVQTMSPIQTMSMPLVPVVSCGCQQPLTVYRRLHHHCGHSIPSNIRCCGCRHLDHCLPTCNGVCSSMSYCPIHNHCA